MGQLQARAATDITASEFFPSGCSKALLPLFPFAVFPAPFNCSSHAQTQTNLLPTSKELVVCSLGLSLGRLASRCVSSSGPRGHTTDSVRYRADHSNGCNADVAGMGPQAEAHPLPNTVGGPSLCPALAPHGQVPHLQCGHFSQMLINFLCHLRQKQPPGNQTFRIAPKMGGRMINIQLLTAC